MKIGAACFVFAIFLRAHAQNSPAVGFQLTDCGPNKYSCMTKPASCASVDACELVAAWAPTVTGVDFMLIGGKTNDQTYVSIGFGDSTKMDKSKTTICSHLSTGDVSVYNSYSVGYANDVLPAPDTTTGISNVEVTYTNGRLYCRFERAIAPSGSSRLPRLDINSVVQLCSGPMSGPRKHGIHFSTPVVSGLQNVSQSISTGRVATTDLAAKTRPLWRAHGILMILAWVLMVLPATLQPRYYRFMWASKKVFNKPVWFIIHLVLMVLAVVLATAGFILAFVAADGEYREPTEMPQNVHPILGIIVMVIAWINPFIPFFGPSFQFFSPGSTCRLIVIWSHFILGAVSIVFAVVTCFIGLSFSSIRAPAWTAYVFIAAIVFHLVVLIVLELAGCFFYAQNKENQEKYQQRQQRVATIEGSQQSPRRPEPAGNPFKIAFLALHSFILTALVVAIVVGIVIN